MTTHSQRALILYRRRRFINHLLTYLLTYLIVDKSSQRLQTPPRPKLIRIGMSAGSVSECCRFIMSCLSSVYCPSRGHISKTKQDRSVVTMKHYIEVGTTYTVAASRSSSRHSWGDTLVADVENVFNCPVRLWRQDPGVVNRVQPSDQSLLLTLIIHWFTTSMVWCKSRTEAFLLFYDEPVSSDPVIFEHLFIVSLMFM